jgi:hypothetical protein
MLSLLECSFCKKRRVYIWSRLYGKLERILEGEG